MLNALIPRYYYRVSVFMLLGLAIGCNRTGNRDATHPNREMLLSPDLPRTIITAQAADGAGDRASLYAERLTAMVPLVQIGSREGSPGQMIGLAQSAQFDGDSAVLILDSRFNTVNSYDGRGRYLGSIGGPGRGPGEFFLPLGMVFDGSRKLFVNDESMQIHRFERDDSGWSYKESLRVDFLPIDFCVADSLLFVHGFSDTRSEVIYRFDLEGKPLGSFAVPYRSANPLIRQSMTEGRIQCSDSGDVVFIAFARMPEIHAYTSSGELIWISEMERYAQMPIVENANGSTRLGLSLLHGDEQMHLLRAFALTPTGELIIQLALYEKADFDSTKTHSAIDTYVVDAGTGAGRYIGREVPVVADVTHSLFLAIADEPFPHATVYEMTSPSAPGTENN